MGGVGGGNGQFDLNWGGVGGGKGRERVEELPNFNLHFSKFDALYIYIYTYKYLYITDLGTAWRKIRQLVQRYEYINLYVY